ncbi:hypothetical protein ACFP8W_25845, partial [Nocardioides hankookensis]
MPGSLRVETRQRLDGRRAAWDGLVADQPVPSPFLRSWWLEGVAPTDTTFVLVLDGERLVGGLALQE